MAAVVGALLINTRKRREYKENSTYLNLTTREFRERYRFSENGINYICNEIQDVIQNETGRSHSLSVKEKVLLTLRYYASGSFMQAVGDTIGRDKATVSRTVQQVTDALCGISGLHIRWSDNEMMSASKNTFYRIACFPNIVGCVDGTHVRLLKPGAERERPFINRKRHPSINAMCVVDHRGCFTYVNAKWPGSAHDSFIFRSSYLCVHLENTVQKAEDGILLGDSGYACSKYMMTPHRNTDRTLQ